LQLYVKKATIKDGTKERKICLKNNKFRKNWNNILNSYCYRLR